MSNNGEPDTNASQFYITTKRTAWLDGEFVVFGKVTDGWEVIRSFLQERVDDDERPLREIKIIGANHKKLTRPTVSLLSLVINSSITLKSDRSLPQ